MTKGEIRKARKQARESGNSWTAAQSCDGHLEIVKQRTAKQERRHERAMERWATRCMDSDPDWR